MAGLKNISFLCFGLREITDFIIDPGTHADLEFDPDAYFVETEWSVFGGERAVARRRTLADLYYEEGTKSFVHHPWYL